MPNVLVPLATGFEELEAVTIIDILRRAGAVVVTAGLEEGPVRASRGVVVLPDVSLEKVRQQDFDLIVLPGGLPGADHLQGDVRLLAMLRRAVEMGHSVAAICAAPKVLAHEGLLDGRSATCYPGCLDPQRHPQVRFLDQAVVEDRPVVTSRGPGTAMDFALILVERLMWRETRDRVEAGLVRNRD